MLVSLSGIGMGAGLVFNLLRILCSIYRGQSLVLDLSRTDSCPQFLPEGILSSIQTLVFDKSRASFRPRYIEDKILSSINREQDSVDMLTFRI